MPAQPWLIPSAIKILKIWILKNSCNKLSNHSILKSHYPASLFHHFYFGKRHPWPQTRGMEKRMGSVIALETPYPMRKKKLIQPNLVFCNLTWNFCTPPSLYLFRASLTAKVIGRTASVSFLQRLSWFIYGLATKRRTSNWNRLDSGVVKGSELPTPLSLKNRGPPYPFGNSLIR
jgi:hypothetical protein